MIRATRAATCVALACIAWVCGCGGDTVEPPPQPTTVRVTPAKGEFTALGETVQFSAQVLDQRGDQMGGTTVTWASDSTAVATVSGSGLATAVGNGMARIVATAGAISGSAIAEVRQVGRSAAVLPGADTLILGDSLRLEAEALDANGHLVPDALYRWVSWNPQVVTVSTRGVVRAVSEGVAEIHATTGTATGVARITVFSPDRAALVAFYHATNGPNWIENENWLTEVPLWGWHGVYSDSAGRVSGLTLHGHYDIRSGEWTRFGLEGPIPPELGSLAELETLWLFGNEFSGTIPAAIGELASLKSLDLSTNQLTGPIPPEIGSLTSLEGLSLHNNSLEGAIPPEVGSLTKLETLVLYRNELSGMIPAAFGELASLKSLDLSFNRLAGPIPSQLGGLANLEQLALHNNSLEGAIPPELGGLTNLKQLSLYDNSLEGAIPSELGGLANLEQLSLYNNSLEGAIPPELGRLAKLKLLSLQGNELSGTIPATFGNLARLTTLNLSDNRLTGPIPPELASLSGLTGLQLQGNDLTGPIPPGLGDLENLTRLELHTNELTGEIPGELGRLVSLEILSLLRNKLTGPIPPQLGSLQDLRQVDLRDNALTGPLPAELGNLSRLKSLLLATNELTGPVPPEFGGMTALRELFLANNAGLAGAIPPELTALTRLEVFLAGGTDLCASTEPGLAEWLNGVPRRWIQPCPETELAEAYLIQAAQSREFPVPLVAGEQALLRVFVTASEANSEGIPAVRARFYADGRETYVADIPAKSSPIPTTVDESSLDRSANAVIPGDLIQPGLEMVVEVDPDMTLDPDLGVAKRIPEVGRLEVDVRSMPVLDLTLIPFIWTERHDSSVVDLVRSMEADPENHDMLGLTRTLLPVEDLDVTAHEPVLTSTNNTFALLAATRVIRTMEGGTGHYAGLMPLPLTGEAVGAAVRPGRSTFQVTSPIALAHELGHNMSLRHPACVGDNDSDLAYPHAEGAIGVWGYDFRNGGSLVSSSNRDLMGACIHGPPWISDYNFTRALQFRLGDEDHAELTDRGAQARTLLLWGGLDVEGAPFLEPALVVDAPAALPDAAGDYRIAGRSAEGAELFSLDFAMPAIADGGGRSVFAFAVPVQSSWTGELASITLSGPGGTATLNGDSDNAVTILRDRRSGQVRGILRGMTAQDGSQTAAMASPATRGALEVLVSRGIPGAVAWNR